MLVFSKKSKFKKLKAHLLFPKANTNRKCKFWDSTWQCKYDKGGCVVEACPLDSVPTGLKGEVNNSKIEKVISPCLACPRRSRGKWTSLKFGGGVCFWV